MPNEIIIEPFGGLANRMRVIASVLWLAGQTQSKIKLIWELNQDLNCPFEELFEPIENVKIIKKRFKFRVFRSAYRKSVFKRIIIKLIDLVLAKKYTIIEDADIKKIRLAELDVFSMIKSNKTLYFRTCEEFGTNLAAFKLFIPLPELQRRINECCDHFNDRTIGIHIRRTDHEVAIKNSPVELFVERIGDDLQKNPEINFFLTTDDPETENAIKLLFGNKILINNKVFTRNTIEGIKDALVDFYCLANTSKIYGSYWSSFSYIAARIHGIKVEMLKIQDKT